MATSAALSLMGIGYVGYRQDWLDRHSEQVIEPDLPIVDPHHHVWDLPRPRYMFGELHRDIGSGHNIVATMYVDCRSMYRADGPEEMRSVGEVEFANGVAAMSASGGYGKTLLCHGIVGNADLRLGAGAKPVLEALIRAGGGRFRGIRNISAWDADPDVHMQSPARPRGLLQHPGFLEGFRTLAPLGLSFDAYFYHPQIPELTALARAFPDTRIILDHIGAPVGVGSYAGKREAIFAEWSRSIRELARCPNVWIKIGGMGMRVFGFGFELRPEPPTSQDLAAAWGPYVDTCIDAFGVERSMFESNFPPDKGSCSYPVLWNAFKRIAEGCSADEKAALFSRTAARCYNLDLPQA